jgi:transcriptional regulator of acetoin/glycerol metabolism
MALLRAYSWPGNVRELRNAIEHAIAIGDGQAIGPSDFPEALLASQGARNEALGRLSRTWLSSSHGWSARRSTRRLRVARGNRTHAGALLGILRSSLYNKLRDMGQAPGAAYDEG